MSLLQLEARAERSRDAQLAYAEQTITRAAPADLIILPEMWLTGYFSFDRYEQEAEGLDGEAVAFTRDMARTVGAYVAGGSFVEREPASGKLFNTAFLVDPEGKLILTYRKVHVFGYESREAQMLSGGGEANVVNTDLGTIGLSTCYDLRFPELYRHLTDAGAQILIVPAAWPLARRDHWRLLTSARAVENQCVVLACNQSGVEGGTKLAGHSRAVDAWGGLIGEIGDGTDELNVAFDPSSIDDVRETFPALRDRVLNTRDWSAIE